MQVPAFSLEVKYYYLLEVNLPLMGMSSSHSFNWWYMLTCCLHPHWATGITVWSWSSFGTLTSEGMEILWLGQEDQCEDRWNLNALFHQRPRTTRGRRLGMEWNKWHTGANIHPQCRVNRNWLLSWTYFPKGLPEPSPLCSRKVCLVPHHK